MMNVRMNERVLAGLAALMVFAAGIGVGGWIANAQRRDAGEVAAAFSTSLAQEPGGTSDLPTETVPPSPTPSAGGAENWFAIETVETAAPSATTMAGGDGASPDDATPEPAATDTSTFLIELVREDDGTAPADRAKRVLIYHTHTFEAYQQTEADPYRETQEWRTEDNNHNVVCVGEELAALLRGMGVEVVHDTSAFEFPDYNTSYTRSLSMLETRKNMGESYDLYIDLHRDAAATAGGANVVTVGDTKVAKLMLLIGKGEGQTDAGYEEKPEWQDNLAIAQKITDELNAQVPGLGKDIRIKSGRFNQHIAIGCVLVEVGNNRNTLAEAKAAMPYLADAVAAFLRSGQ